LLLLQFPNLRHVVERRQSLLIPNFLRLCLPSRDRVPRSIDRRRRHLPRGQSIGHGHHGPLVILIFSGVVTVGGPVGVEAALGISGGLDEAGVAVGACYAVRKFYEILEYRVTC